MSCRRMENRILTYVDGRLKESERLEVEKHLSACGACRLRVNEFRAVTSLLEEVPQIEPSSAFDVRVRARVAAEPVKQGWWAWFTPSPRVAFAASLLLLATVWMGYESKTQLPFENPKEADAQMMEEMQVLDDQDVISNFDPLKDLPQPVQPEDQTNQTGQPNQTM
ncbi:MAG TPA: zf-HC2 domain-containing protein [Candidatus Cybelea sp.]|jgi:anti-sigma factor RsiW|nr:zf-HC2 domain-containing protein [Candidatus Cybelea sp.]